MLVEGLFRLNRAELNLIYETLSRAKFMLKILVPEKGQSVSIKSLFGHNRKIIFQNLIEVRSSLCVSVLVDP